MSAHAALEPSSIKTEKKLAEVERRSRVLRLTRQGVTPADIVRVFAQGSQSHPAEEITVGQIKRIVRRYLETVHTEDALTIEQLRVMENERIDTLWRDLNTQLSDAKENKDPKLALGIIDRMTKLSERRAKLNGLDAPAKVEHSIGFEQIREMGADPERIEQAEQAWLRTFADYDLPDAAVRDVTPVAELDVGDAIEEVSLVE